MIRFTAGTTVYRTAHDRTATVLIDAIEHKPVTLRWDDTQQEDCVLPEAVESIRQHNQRKAGARR